MSTRRRPLTEAERWERLTPDQRVQPRTSGIRTRPTEPSRVSRSDENAIIEQVRRREDAASAAAAVALAKRVEHIEQELGQIRDVIMLDYRTLDSRRPRDLANMRRILSHLRKDITTPFL